MLNLSFIILTWNSAKYVRQCLDSIENAFRNTDDNIYVFLIDNGSSDNTVDILQAWKKKSVLNVYVIPLKQNLGTTRSRNIGISRAMRKSEHICILDSDTEITFEAICALVDDLQENPKIGIVGPVLKGLDGAVQNSGRNIPTVTLKLLKILPLRFFQSKGENMEVIKKTSSLTKVGYLMSACWLLRTDMIRNIGLLDENIFYAPEDVEYCIRAWKNGYHVIYDKNISIIHRWQRLSRRKILSKHNYEHIKGLIYLFMKYRYFLRTNFLREYMK